MNANNNPIIDRSQVGPQYVPEHERNSKLIRFWKTGRYSKASLARMFKITRERARAIIERYENE